MKTKITNAGAATFAAVTAQVGSEMLAGHPNTAPIDTGPNLAECHHPAAGHFEANHSGASGTGTQ